MITLSIGEFSTKIRRGLLGSRKCSVSALEIRDWRQVHITTASFAPSGFFEDIPLHLYKRDSSGDGDPEVF